MRGHQTTWDDARRHFFRKEFLDGLSAGDGSDCLSLRTLAQLLLVRYVELMSTQRPHRQMFPESRLVLGILSPVLGVFFAVCIYVTSVWQPSTVVDRVGKFLVEDILFTFMTVCAVAFIASVVGPQRVQRLVVPVGFKAGLAGLALIVGTVVYMLYCWLTL